MFSADKARKIQKESIVLTIDLDDVFKKIEYIAKSGTGSELLLERFLNVPERQKLIELGYMIEIQKIPISSSTDYGIRFKISW